MSYRIRGLSPAPFEHLFGLSDADLATLGVERHRADASPGYPDRIELRDAEPGETLLLLNYTHQPAATPYRASHAIFVLEGAREAFDRVDEVPAAMRLRPLSLRGFDDAGQMIAADLAIDPAIEETIERLLADPGVDYIQAHYARRGCFAARIDRA